MQCAVTFPSSIDKKDPRFVLSLSCFKTVNLRWFVNMYGSFHTNHHHKRNLFGWSCSYLFFKIFLKICFFCIRQSPVGFLIVFYICFCVLSDVQTSRNEINVSYYTGGLGLVLSCLEIFAGAAGRTGSARHTLSSPHWSWEHRYGFKHPGSSSPVRGIIHDYSRYVSMKTFLINCFQINQCF